MTHLLPVAILTARPDGEFDYANRRFYQMLGLVASGDDVGDLLMQAAHPHEPSFKRNWLNGIRGGELFSFEVPLRTARGTRWYELRAAPDYEGTHVGKWIITIDDVHERVMGREEVSRARLHLRALADIGAITLERSLRDQDLVERTLCCAATAIDATWVATCSADGSARQFTFPPEAHVPDGILEDADTISGPVMRTPIGDLEGTDHVLSVIGKPGRDSYDQLDVDFVRDVAWRIGNALQNASAFRWEAHVARVLQTAMLPVALPRTSRIAFDVSYVTAESETLIGGDWYDALELPNGRMTFSIGDVAGHGLESAVVMGHVREVVRAACLRGASPGDVLTEVNGIVMASGYGLISAIVAHLDPSTMELQYASAGHPPPLHVEANGSVRSLELGDVILGAIPRAKFRTQVAELKAAGALVLYTNGLIEFGRDAIAGELRLHRVLSAWANENFKATANELSERMLSGSAARDDVALLVVRIGRDRCEGYISERRTPASRAADSRS